MRNNVKNTIGKLRRAIRESARQIVAAILEEENPDQFFEYQVYEDPNQSNLIHGQQEVCYNIQVPVDKSLYVNKVFVPRPLDERGIKEIELRLSQLAKQRSFPPGSFFNAPWGTYLIHGGTIGKI